MFRRRIFTTLLVAAGLVSAHGGGQHYIIDGVTYRGNWDALGNTEGSIQRSWSWGFNVVDIANPDMACGHDGTPHANSLYAPVQAGNTVSINYTTEDAINPDNGKPWTFGHPIGPMQAYMAACPDEGCEDVDLNSAIWFKVWEAGLLSGTWPEGHWAMRDVFDGANLDVPTPTSLKPGKYLFRHEMLNLQTGPAQWFPNCIQLQVDGSGSSFPAAEELISFEESYAKDMDISFGWDASGFYGDHAKDTEYPIPGPPVWEG